MSDTAGNKIIAKWLYDNRNRVEIVGAFVEQHIARTVHHDGRTEEEDPSYENVQVVLATPLGKMTASVWVTKEQKEMITQHRGWDRLKEEDGWSLPDPAADKGGKE